MAVGFIPKEKAVVPISGIPEATLIAVLLRLLHKGEWHIELEETRMLVGDRSSTLSAGHTLKLIWDENNLSVVCILNGNFSDFGSCRKVLDKFLDDFQHALSDIDENEVQHWLSQYQTALARLQENMRQSNMPWWHALLPSRESIATPVIFWINIGIFLAMAATGSDIWTFKGADLVAWGSNYSESTLSGQWWRLFTYMFLHGGFLHLAMNSFSLIVLGYPLERIIGTRYFIFFYLLSGLAASVTSLWWHPLVNSVGASGAIFGLMGILLALQISALLKDDNRRSNLTSTIFIIGVNLLYGMQEGIDNAAHIGGFMYGLISGLMLAYFVRRKMKPALRYFSIVVPATALLGISMLIMPDITERAINTQKNYIIFGRIEEVYPQKEQEYMSNIQLLKDTTLNIHERYEFAEVRRVGYQNLLRSLDSIQTELLPNQLEERVVLLRTYTQNKVLYFETFKSYLSPGGEGKQQELDRLEIQQDSLLQLLNAPR